MNVRNAILVMVVSFACCLPAVAGSGIRGIYISQSTMEDTPRIQYLVSRARTVGINTFVVDFDRFSRQYAANIPLLRQNGIRYVARIVIFPEGGTPERINSLAWREKKFRLMEGAIQLGAQGIQMDYIRYNTRQGKSVQHVMDINRVIHWYRERLAARRVPLEVDVFGITSFGPEHHIGQDVRQMAQYVDALCPMDYPSHFQPFAHYSAQPRETVRDALFALKSRFENGRVPVDVIPWIEMSNYHYAWTDAGRRKYIAAQIRGVDDAGVQGWYAWSPNNLYDGLFRVLATGVR